MSYCFALLCRFVVLSVVQQYKKRTKGYMQKKLNDMSMHRHRTNTHTFTSRLAEKHVHRKSSRRLNDFLVYRFIFFFYSRSSGSCEFFRSLVVVLINLVSFLISFIYYIVFLLFSFTDYDGVSFVLFSSSSLICVLCQDNFLLCTHSAQLITRVRFEMNMRKS